jgi:hypothetical protein
MILTLVLKALYSELSLYLLLQLIMEVIMVMQSGRGDPHTATFHKRYSRSVVHRPLLENAPSPFAEAVIGLATELIAVTNCLPDRMHAKFRYCSFV